MTSKKWLIGWFIFVGLMLSAIMIKVYRIDPYIHFHKPDTNKYYYKLDNQRSQNDGITRNFEYDAIITGTSMAANFKTSELDKLFDVNSIKISYYGASYKEINENLKVALEHNPGLKIIIRGLDIAKFFDDKDKMEDELGDYPTYLYDENPFNDVEYIFNRDVIFGRVFPMSIESKQREPGITSFDEYANWQAEYSYGIKTVRPNGIEYNQTEQSVHLSEADKMRIIANFKQNVVSLPEQYPEVDFYYYITPYSAAWWCEQATYGSVNRWIEAENLIIELLLGYDNVHLYSINDRTEIITNLNHYKDAIHYAEWINSFLLEGMKTNEFLLTKDNYKEYIEKLKFYTIFDYEKLNSQVDYEDDEYARILIGLNDKQ